MPASPPFIPHFPLSLCCVFFKSYRRCAEGLVSVGLLRVYLLGLSRSLSICLPFWMRPLLSLWTGIWASNQWCLIWMRDKYCRIPAGSSVAAVEKGFSCSDEERYWQETPITYNTVRQTSGRWTLRRTKTTRGTWPGWTVEQTKDYTVNRSNFV